MNVIENRLNVILEKEGDVAAEILQVCEKFDTDEMISVNSQLQKELIERLSKNELEEDVWNCLLSSILPENLSEEVLNYLLHNHICLQTLCHMPLQDKWLKKLSTYDDAPLYTLTKRYYLSKEYSELEFLQFYNQYLWNKDDISLHLLDIYSNADKRGLLIFLCSNNKKFENKERLQWYRVAERVRGITNSADIQSIYEEYQNIGIVLSEIASNYFTSTEILLELLSVKGILYANKIRKKSEKTLRLKQIVEQA